MKNKIDPRHAELFEEMFGANAKGENVCWTYTMEKCKN